MRGDPGKILLIFDIEDSVFGQDNESVLGAEDILEEIIYSLTHGVGVIEDIENQAEKPRFRWYFQLFYRNRFLERYLSRDDLESRDFLLDSVLLDLKVFFR